MTARVSLCLLLALAAPVLAACGNDRGTPPDLTSPGEADPGDLDTYTTFGADAVTFIHPKTWDASAGEAPVLAQLGSGGASATIYAYPRDDLPTDEAGVEASLDRVVESLRRRAPGFLVIEAGVTEVADSPAVEVRGRGTVAGRSVETRSVHIYREGVEYVIDAFARPDAFADANRVAFAPLLDSIELNDAVAREGDA